MKRSSLALAVGALLLIAAQAAAAAPADTCTFDHHVSYWTTTSPPHPVAGQPLSLVFHDCTDCDHILSAAVGDSGGVYLQFVSRAICPLTLVCNPESLAVPIGTFAAGNYAIKIFVHARVLTSLPDSVACDAYQTDVFEFAVRDTSTPPPPGPLPFVTAVHIGRDSGICPGDSIPVSVAGFFPNTCYSFRGLQVLTDASVPPGLDATIVRLLVGVEGCQKVACLDVLVPFAGTVKLPGQPAGRYTLPIQEVWVSACDSTKVDSVFQAVYPFAVAESCVTTPPNGCFVSSWEHTVGGCDAFVAPDHPAQVTMNVFTNVPLAGLQSTLALSPPGLAIANLEPMGPVASWKIAWQRTTEGARFVMFATDGSVIPPSLDLPLPPVLRVTVGIAGNAAPAPVTYLATMSETASDPHGNLVPPCPILMGPVEEAVRICFGPAHSCDLNGDGHADIRDLVLMVHCVLGTGPCADTSTARLDCNQDGLKTLDDVLCCAGEILRVPLPDSAHRRAEPGVQVSFGTPVRTAIGVDVPLRIAGVDRLGAARLALRFPSDRFSYSRVEAESPQWLALGQADGPDLVLGLIGIGPANGPATSLGVTLHLALRSGEQPGGEVRLSSGDFSGPDGAALDVALAPAVMPVDGVPRVILAAPQPNPFSREARFSVTIPPRTGDLEVTIHDLAGRRIATVFHGSLVHAMFGSDGPWTLPFRWAGTDDGGTRVRDGVYFLHVRAGGQELTSKVILLRGN